MSEKRTYMIHESDYRAHDRDSDGLCLECANWTTGGVEPDARKYQCEICDKKAVYGAAQAMIMGRLIPVADNEEIPEDVQTKQ